MRHAEKLRWLILAAQREGNRMLAAALRPLGLTPAQAEVLRLLGDHEPLTLTGLGGLLVCESGTNPSRLIDRVVALGLVSRATPDAGDRRQVILRLTAKGRELESAVRGIEEAMYAELDGVGTDAEVSAVIAVLERVVAGRPAGKRLRGELREREEACQVAIGPARRLIRVAVQPIRGGWPCSPFCGGLGVRKQEVDLGEVVRSEFSAGGWCSVTEPTRRAPDGSKISHLNTRHMGVEEVVSCHQPEGDPMEDQGKQETVLRGLTVLHVAQLQSAGVLPARSDKKGIDVLLVEAGYSQTEVGAILGKSQQAVSEAYKKFHPISKSKGTKD